eukprot:16439891-Heterocapsa_arctica.AAC.2
MRTKSNILHMFVSGVACGTYPFATRGRAMARDPQSSGDPRPWRGQDCYAQRCRRHGPLRC